MQVKLIVRGGSKAGLEIPVSGPRFLIGREEGCQLRPKSDLISRKHCEIAFEDGHVVVRDLKSRNGVHVNGEKIDRDKTLNPGDILRIGGLEFDVHINHSLGAGKRTAVKSVDEAVARMAEAKPEAGSISDWLTEADELERVRRMASPDTRHIRLEETHDLSAKGQETQGQESGLDESHAKDETVADESATGRGRDSGFLGRFGKKTKKEKGKLPPIVQESRDTREAASDALRRFFNNR